MDIILGIGSSTVFPVAELYARRYVLEQVHPIVRSTGSSLGIRNLLAGSTEIGHASRPLQPKDYENVDCDGSFVTDGGIAVGPCQGKFPQGVKIGNDLIAIMVHPTNPITNMAFSAVEQLFSATNTQTFLQAVGAGPNVVPSLYIPDVLSGTYDFFAGEISTQLPESGGFSNDEDLISALGMDPNGLGFTGLAFAVGEPGIKIIAVDGLNPTTVVGSDVENYAFFRPLFMYYDGNKVTSQQNVIRRYICGLLDDDGQKLVEDVGYVGLDAVEKANIMNVHCTGIGNSPGDIGIKDNSAQLANCRDSREIVMLGSSTVSPVAVQLSTLNRNTFLYMTGRSAGSSVGIQSFLAGAETIGDASRALRSSDYEALGCNPDDVTDDGIALGTCQGILPRGLLIGQDMLAVVINVGNTWADNLTEEQLVCLFDMADFNAAQANDDAKMTFADCGIPNAPANIPSFYIPDKQSGTRGFFDDEVVPVNIPGFVDDEVIIDMIQGDSNGVGFFGLAFAKTVLDEIIVFKIDGNDPLVAADQPNYLLRRPLFMYYDATIEGYTFEVYDHLCYMLSTFAQNVVDDVGYVKLEEDEITKTKQELGLAC